MGAHKGLARAPGRSLAWDIDYLAEDVATIRELVQQQSDHAVTCHNEAVPTDLYYPVPVVPWQKRNSALRLVKRPRKG